MNEDETITTTKATRDSRRRTTIIGIVAAAIVLVIIAGFVLMVHYQQTGPVRDVIIILMGLESLTVGGLTLYLIYQVIMLVRMLRDEVEPLIKSAQETVNSARGTATFVSKKIVQPTITISSSTVRVTAMLRALFRGKR
jgi:hypothetical protein